jgi:predicted lactoylglutathione lyase
MNIKQFWFNLPVKDMAKSKEFFKKIGFRENEMHKDNPTVGSFFVDSKDTVMMLFPEDTIKGFMSNSITDTKSSNEVLFNISADSREEVDQMAELVRSAGGEIFGQPGEADGWMYAFGFSDPDGHRWSMLYMDMTKMPK